MPDSCPLPLAVHPPATRVHRGPSLRSPTSCRTSVPRAVAASVLGTGPYPSPPLQPPPGRPASELAVSAFAATRTSTSRLAPPELAPALHLCSQPPPYTHSAYPSHRHSLPSASDWRLHRPRSHLPTTTRGRSSTKTFSRVQSNRARWGLFPCTSAHPHWHADHRTRVPIY
ncbi:hypothetical protein FIBSPDRAFT_878256 [Athelia psychrophila]|uniref:Uncharacterized protein n=1 Tax=Athelia psychrophila TaxID=1759441 RepID=A0A167V653_9AGAM|nr:hypothetical protein FIBSPDRAFT_878547 [Fibularhizoctonia sp. CBS 109695]KZP04674.1 hypothetical protein FIBSPDRAFT_878256 [Fibularhizoctonia sp. CBS 109695]